MATRWILTVRKQKKICKVITHKGTVTPILDVSATDTVEWRNRTDDRMVINVPHPILLVGGVPKIVQEEVPSGGTSTQFSLAPTTPNSSKVYVYSVWCQTSEDWAIGNSDPEIIIEA